MFLGNYYYTVIAQNCTKQVKGVKICRKICMCDRV